MKRWISLLCLICLPAAASPDGERAALERLSREIEALEPLVAEAESEATPDTRVRFRYDWLRRDLQAIREGVREHATRPRTEPRSFAPIGGEYR